MENLAQEAFAYSVSVALKLLFVIFIVALPVVLIRWFWKIWMEYVRADFFSKQKYTLIECHLPKGVIKPPLAMEIVISSMFQTGGEGTWVQRYWEGSNRPWFSLEIVSIDGQVKFFIWAREKFREMIETQLYSQFPDIEIDEMTGKDYAQQVAYDPEHYEYHGCEFIKSGPSHLPIKTYTAYGMTGASEKEEGKIDPMTPMIEFMGSLRQGEQAWLQICIRAHVKDKKKPGGKWFEKVDWKYEAEKDLIKRNKRDIKIDPTKAHNPNLLIMSKAEKEASDAIEQSLSKLPFDAGIRAMYIAEKDKYRKSSEAGINGLLANFGGPTLNSFKKTKAPGFDYPWQDLSGKKTAKQKKELLELYQYRSFFVKEYIPEGYKDAPYVMTTEELATVYHFPGQVARTPNLARISAKKVEPPTNLPI